MLKIRDVELKSRVIIAPMAGITNQVFRKIMRKHMTGLICSEMISDKGLCYRNKKTLEMIEISEAEMPVSLQLFGGDVKTLVEAAKYVDQHSNCAIIDLNMGCPVKKVLKTGGGANLLTEPEKVKEIVTQVVQAVKKPVSVKIRMGYDNRNINYLEIGKIIEQAGASAITLHARTKSQMYGGQADWLAIKQLKNHLQIPVIGNGDIDSVETAREMFEQTNCDAVMIGRAILGNPWLAKEIEYYLETGNKLPVTTSTQKIDQAIEHLNELVSAYGEKLGVVQMRGLGAWYLKGLPNNSKIKQALNQAISQKEMIALFSEYRKNLENI